MTTERDSLVADARAQTRHALARTGLRLARSLGGPAPDAFAAAMAFAEHYAGEVGPMIRAPSQSHALAQLEAIARTPQTAVMLQDLVLLACLPEAHEGFGSLCRAMHPEGLARPTGALALHWLESEADANANAHAEPFALRDRIEALLCDSPLAALGLVQLRGEGPWHARSLHPGPGVWEALMANPPRLERAELVSGYAQIPGLEGWLASAAVQQAIQALRRGLPCQLLLIGGDAAMRATRVLALLGAAQTPALRTELDGLDDAGHARHAGAACTAALMHRAALWFESRHDEAAPERPPAALPRLDWALPVISSARAECGVAMVGQPLIRVPVEPLPPHARRALWQSLLPQFGEHAALLAARYPIDPDDARDVVRDLHLRQAVSTEPLALDAVGDCIRARTPWHGRPGVQRVAPRAGWSTLLLPEPARKQIHSAVRRVLQQITVLDDWGFAQGRNERRGVRLLFYGPPGSGKSLAAEVMAHALGVDLLVVDLASLVSKWLGETEKNLAAVFDLAERARALLLFDEADALFAKRTEASDAHARYANMETAYLLQRLERYEGVAVLTTNLRANLDAAFSRRFEYIVEFPEPDAAAREALWRLHLPEAAPLAADVDLAELAAWYALSGAQIKNAALAAAFFAAAAGLQIHQRHFLLAVEREFDKAGRAHPGFPPRHRGPMAEADLLPLDAPFVTAPKAPTASFDPLCTAPHRG